MIIGKIFIQNFDCDFYQVQKLGSTRNKSGVLYSLDLNELIVREVCVSTFHTSVVTSLKIYNYSESDMRYYIMVSNA